MNAAIVESVRDFYYELKERHSGRYPKMVRHAWLSMNTVLGGVQDVPLTRIAEAVGVNVERLYEGKKKWTTYLETGALELLEEVDKIHGNAWPKEWTEFVQAMWLHESVTRKGEGGGDYCRDPKAKRGKGGLHHIHWLETPQYVVQEKIQAAAELMFNTTAFSGEKTLYSDGKPRACFPPRPKQSRQRRGGGIGKKVGPLKPFQIRRKGRGQCLCHWHLEWDLLCADLNRWRVANRNSGRGAEAACKCDCPLIKNGYEMRKALLCPREGTSSDKTKRPVLGVDFETPPCLDCSCENCGDMQKLPLCEAELAVVRPVTYNSWETAEYMTNKGEKRTRSDFVRRSAPIAEFIAHMKKVFKPFVAHHTTMKWQAWDWACAKENFPKGSWLSVQDFSENLKIEVKLEVRTRAFYYLFPFCLPFSFPAFPPSIYTFHLPVLHSPSDRTSPSIL